jgi:hypothetical protein
MIFLVDTQSNLEVLTNVSEEHIGSTFMADYTEAWGSSETLINIRSITSHRNTEVTSKRFKLSGQVALLGGNENYMRFRDLGIGWRMICKRILEN